ncbi:flagellar hook protein FlgE [Shinella sp.]|uniref:flagellar hook protein FlgE n=1 Tax=Shinella sp. TaxID=1870904 RepID=UPI00301DBDBF
MSLYGTMRTGVSGMNAQANRLSTVADNIANANTTGYKKASTQFSSLILPTTGGAYNSGGVTTDVRYSISSQGTFTYTTSTTDLAINGKGFFIVQGSDGVEYLTRAGAFTPQADGTLRNSAGFTLMGYPYSSDADPTIVINGFAGLEKINLASGELNVQASQSGYLHVNLPSNEAHPYSKATSLVAYDSLGNTRKLDFTYSTTATPGEWELAVTYTDPETNDVYDMMDPAGPSVIVPPATATPTQLSFDTNGKLDIAGGAPDKITTGELTIGGGVLNGLEISIGGATGGSTQLAAAFAAKGDIDGIGPSGVAGYEISDDGIVYLKYENGDLAPKYRIAMADVQSPDNLKPLPGNVYSQSSDSGVIVMGYAGNGGYGKILSGALEDSNVDIGEELTAMIESQRNYTANSKVFQTGSELMEVLVNLKR